MLSSLWCLAWHMLVHLCVKSTPNLTWQLRISFSTQLHFLEAIVLLMPNHCWFHLSDTLHQAICFTFPLALTSDLCQKWQQISDCEHSICTDKPEFLTKAIFRSIQWTINAIFQLTKCGCVSSSAVVKCSLQPERRSCWVTTKHLIPGHFSVMLSNDCAQHSRSLWCGLFSQWETLHKWICFHWMWVAVLHQDKMTPCGKQPPRHTTQINGFTSTVVTVISARHSTVSRTQWARKSHLGNQKISNYDEAT